jgi:hypothetical protein
MLMKRKPVETDETRIGGLGLFCGDDHFTLLAVKMQGEASAVVQQEQLRIWSNIAEAGREILAVSFLMDRADAKFMADAVFGAHEFGTLCMFQFIGLTCRCHSCIAIGHFRKAVGDILSV